MLTSSEPVRIAEIHHNLAIEFSFSVFVHDAFIIAAFRLRA